MLKQKTVEREKKNHRNVSNFLNNQFSLSCFHCQHFPLASIDVCKQFPSKSAAEEVLWAPESSTALPATQPSENTSK